MSSSWIESFLAARVYDLEQPRHAGMPIHPVHKPGYLYTLHRRHHDTYNPDQHGPRSSASGALVMMEHTGTHIDALSHQARDLCLFGGVPVEKAETPTGFTTHGVETIPPLRRGDACAFSLQDDDGAERIVVVVQAWPADPADREALRAAIAQMVKETVGVDGTVQLIRPSVGLPLTSSGKLSRSRARTNWLAGVYKDGGQRSDVVAVEAAARP